MLTPNFSRVLAAVVIAVSVLAVQVLGVTPAAADGSSVNVSGSLTPGATLQVESGFVAPGAAGNYVVDTEVFNASGNRVAQWFETVWLGSTSNVRTYSWNTAGLGAGTYSFQKGIFTAGWTANRGWNANAGTVTLGSAPAASSTSWALTASTAGTSPAHIDASFTAPSNFAPREVQLNTEIQDARGVKVAQWVGVAAMSPGQKVNRSYDWNTANLAAGTYTVKLGVHEKDWSRTILFKSTSATVKVGSSTAARVTTTTAAPTTTTTKAPTTTTTAAPVSGNWSLSNSDTGTNPVKVSSTFQAPSGFGGTVQFNTEVHNSAGTKIAQWTNEVAMSSGQSVTRSYDWSNAPAGTHTVHVGVFSADWTKQLAWKSDANTVQVASGGGSTTTTTVNSPVVNQPSGSVTSGNPLVSANGFYANPYSQAANQAKAWAASRPGDAAYMDRIAKGGAATWLGNWNWDVRGDVNTVVSAAASQGQTPVFVAYNIPGRDCGSYSAGGLSGPAAYNSWIAQIAQGINGRKAAVILEPDALAQLDCLSATAQSERLSMLRNAVNTLSSQGVTVYLDAGHSGWLSASTMAERLRSAGVANARGFSLNVSNYVVTSSEVSFGEQISALIGGKKYVVDTSRNGNGSNGEWCNPMGRALGRTPTTQTGAANADAFIWIKQPGESDGTCNGGPSAGTFWSEYALGLAKAAWG